MTHATAVVFRAAETGLQTADATYPPDMVQEGGPSLVRFLLERLHEDGSLIISNTPVLDAQVDHDFESQFLDRGALLHQLRSDHAIVLLAVEAMQEEQGSPPARASSFVPGPVTMLGSQLLKLLAQRYSAHQDYRLEWQPEVVLPDLP